MKAIITAGLLAITLAILWGVGRLIGFDRIVGGR